MGTLGRLFRGHPTSTPSNPSSWLVDLMGGGPSATGLSVNEISAMTSTAVWACVRILAETVSSLPLHVYQDLPNDGGKDKARDHPLYPLLHDAPNPEMTSMEWREVTMGHLVLFGNSYSEIQRNGAGKVIALWPLRPDRMRVWRVPQGEPHAGELVYYYSLFKGGIATLYSADVLHIRTLSRDGVYGMSPVAQCRESIGLDLALEQFAGKLFGNGARPGGVLQAAGKLTDDSRQNLRDSWNAGHQGLTNAHRVAILEEGITWQATGMPPEDAQFLQTRQFTLNSLARIWRIPPHMLQELARATHNNIEHQSLEFVIHTIRPYLVRFEQAMQLRLFGLASSAYPKFQVDGLLRGDLASRYTAYATARQWGWLSVDDIRELEDMNPLPNAEGEEYLRPLNMVPAGGTFIPPALGPNAGTPAEPSDPADTRSMEFRLFLEEAAGRLARRERQDVTSQARKLLGRGDRAGFQRWAVDFYLGDHLGFTEQIVAPALNGSRSSFAREHVASGLLRIQAALESSEDNGAVLGNLEAALTQFEAEAPTAIADAITQRRAS